MVRGDERHAAPREMAREEGAEQPLSRLIERGERLVERPQRCRVELQARETDATALSRGQAARGKLPMLVETRLAQRGADRIGSGIDAAQGERALQILRGGELVLDRVEVAGVKQRGMKGCAMARGDLAIPQ